MELNSMSSSVLGLCSSSIVRSVGSSFLKNLYLPILLLIGIWAVLCLGLKWIMWLWMFVYVLFGSCMNRNRTVPSVPSFPMATSSPPTFPTHRTSIWPPSVHFWIMDWLLPPFGSFPSTTFMGPSCYIQASGAPQMQSPKTLFAYPQWTLPSSG